MRFEPEAIGLHRYEKTWESLLMDSRNRGNAHRYNLAKHPERAAEFRVAQIVATPSGRRKVTIFKVLPEWFFRSSRWMVRFMYRRIDSRSDSGVWKRAIRRSSSLFFWRGFWDDQEQAAALVRHYSGGDAR